MNLVILKILLKEDIIMEAQKTTQIIEQFFADLPEKALSLGFRVLISIIIFVIGVQLIKLIRKILKKALQRGSADIGVVQFLDSFTKAVLYILLVFMIGENFGLDAASVVALIGSAGVAIGLALQGRDRMSVV